jgi:hypothetical protein
MDKVKSVLAIVNMIPWDLVFVVLLAIYTTLSEIFGSSDKFKHSAVWKYIWNPIGIFFNTLRRK